MARNLTPDRPRILLALVAAALALVIPAGLGQVTVVLLGGMVGLVALRKPPAAAAPDGERVGVRVPISPWVSAVVLAIFAALLVALPLARHLLGNNSPVAVFESFFVVASFVFCGGHVVLRLLQAQVVPPVCVTEQQFLAGYGAAQAVPGPLFTFSAYLT